MTSQKQIRANRENAKKSTGPKTEAGKARSSANAITHGLSAKNAVIPGENPADFNLLVDGLVKEFAPINVLARQLLTQLAGLLWRLRRLPKLEAAVTSVSREALDQQIIARLEAEDQQITFMLGQTVSGNPKYHDFRPERTGPHWLVDNFRADEELGFPERREEEGFPQKGEIVSNWKNSPHKPEETLLDIGRALLKNAGEKDFLGRLARYNVQLARGVERVLRLLRKVQSTHGASRPDQSAVPGDLRKISCKSTNDTGPTVKNAMTRVFTGSQIALPVEDPGTFDALVDGLIDDYVPATFLMREVLEHLAYGMWRSNRVPVLESALIQATRAGYKAESEEMAVFAMWGPELYPKYSSKPQISLDEMLLRDKPHLKKYAEEREKKKKEQPPAVDKKEKETEVPDELSDFGAALVWGMESADAFGALSRYEANINTVVDCFLRMLDLLQEQNFQTPVCSRDVVDLEADAAT